jgi:hypothetical protein
MKKLRKVINIPENTVRNNENTTKMVVELFKGKI